MSKRSERKLRRQELIYEVESQRYELGRLSHVWLESMKPADRLWSIVSMFGLPIAACGGIFMLRQLLKRQRKNPLRLLHYIRNVAGIWTKVRFVHRSLAPKK